MAALSRRTEATYEVHETIKVDTQDNEDHTFCGIMFPIKCKDMLPIDHIVIRSISVRGQLGPMTVWVNKPPHNNRRNGQRNQNNNNSNHTFRLSKSHWIKLYEHEHAPSQTTYQTLALDEPIRLKPGEVRAIYIHSTLPGDQAIVYDNASFYLPHRGGHHQAGDVRKPRYDDSMISIFTGRAHVSNTAFGQMPIWGWGNAWRDHREFVGQLEYGAVYQLWNPETRNLFGPQFHRAMQLMFLCQRKWESPLSMLPDECIYYILNMCRWDWFDDNAQTMTVQQQRREARERVEREQAAASAGAEVATDQANENGNVEESDEDDDENYEDSIEDENEDDDSDDDDDDDDEYDEEDFMDESESEDEDDDDEWEAANGYRANHSVFQFVDPTNEREQEGGAAESRSPARQAWVRRQFARIQILRALAREDDDDDEAGVVDMHVAFS